MSKKIVVIGGGVSGISSAFFALKNGFEVTLIESSSSLGGRINSREDKITGDYIDNGQHLLVGAYNVFINILKEIDTFKFLDIQDKFRVKYIDKIGSFELKEKYFNGEFGLLFGLFDLKQLSTIEKLNAIKFIIKIKLGTFRNDNRILKDTLIESNQSEEIIRILWEPMCIAMLNTPIESASTLIFANVLKQSFFAGGFNSKLITPIVGLSELVKPMEEYLISNGVEILFNTSLKSFEIENNRIKHINLTKDKQISGDFYVSSLPYYKLEKLLDVELGLKSSSIISAYLWYDKKFFNNDFVAVLDKTIQWIFNKRAFGFNQKNNLFPEFLSIVISDADKLINKSNGDILEIIKDEIDELFPVPKTLLHHKIIKEKNATYFSDTNSVLKRKKIKSPYNKLLFAGDWTNSSLPSTIETAARSGKEVIEKIVKIN